MERHLDIKQALAADINILCMLGNSPGEAYFSRCLEEQTQGKRIVLIARQKEQVAGYVFLNWSPRYQPFRRLEIPEIQDLYVVPEFRRQGIGEALVAECERLGRERGCTQMGIAVGLHAGFGSAQRLYVRLGYVPDGGGIVYDREAVRIGELRAIDDELSLMMVKDL